MVLLQETITLADIEWQVAGYTLNLLDIAVVRSAIPHLRIAAPVQCRNSVEVLVLELQVGSRPP